MVGQPGTKRRTSFFQAFKQRVPSLILKNVRLGYHFLSIDTEHEDRVCRNPVKGLGDWSRPSTYSQEGKSQTSGEEENEW